MRVLFLEPNLSPSSPSQTWANALSREAISCQVLDLLDVSTWHLVKEFSRCNVVVIQVYSVISDYNLFRLCIAVLMGKAIVRKWSGTDALNLDTRGDVKQRFLLLDKLVALNLTSEHQGIIDELNRNGLNCLLTPQVLASKMFVQVQPTAIPAKKVLIYLPSHNRDFYSANLMEEVIKANPHIEFLILADKEHVLSAYRNVSSLGWVEDMQHVWAQTGILLRITKHDGFARMMVDALSRGKYVIHNQALPAINVATSLEDISALIHQFQQQDSINKAGIEVISKLIEQQPELCLKRNLVSAHVTTGNWFWALKIIVTSRFHR
jgi:hypothetical protein